MVATTQPKPRILILGGGFAGISAMLRLEKLFSDDNTVDIRLVSRENFFLFTPMLSEAAIGAVDPRHIVTPIRELCRKTEFHRADVLNIDLPRQQVDVLYNSVPGCNDTLTYDHLVLALGSTSNVMLVPGVDRFAFDFKDMEDAIHIRNHILEMFERADTTADPEQKRAMLNFNVIGGGYSGVEIAAAIQSLAERIEPLYPTLTPSDIHVTIVEAQDRILATMPPDLSTYALRQLDAMGITIRLNTRLIALEPTTMTLDSGEPIATYTVVWTTGVVIPALLTGLPVEKDAKGRPLGTPELRLRGYTNVWAMGDNVLTPLPDGTGFYPATAQVAVEQGEHVARNLYRVLHQQDPEPFCYQQKGEMVVLGERSAVAMVMGRTFKGFPAWLMWRLFYLLRLPRGKKRTRVAFDWLLNLFGPMETAQIKLKPYQEACDIWLGRVQEPMSPQNQPSPPG